jgi:hypothetical protein
MVLLGLVLLKMPSIRNGERLRITSNGELAVPGGIGPQIRFENQHSVTTDAAISTFDDASGTLLCLGSNFYFNSSGSETRYNTSEESAAVVLDRAGIINFLTGDTSLTATSRMRITSAGLVGIGTTSVDAKLHIQGVSGTYPTSIFNHSAIDVEGEVIRIGRTDSTARYHSIYGKQSAINSSNYLQFRVHDGSASSPFTSQSTVMTLTGQGRVGIGTTSPGFTLDVNGNPGFGTTGGVNKCFIKRAIDGTANSYIGYLSTNSTDFAVKNGSGAGDVILEGNAGNIRFNTASSTERARIDTSGRLLIGTSSGPSAGLGQYSTFVAQGYVGLSTGEASISLQRGQAAASITSGTGLGYINFNDNAGYTFANISAFADANAGTGDYPGRLVFSTTADGASSPTERMRIRSDFR